MNKPTPFDENITRIGREKAERYTASLKQELKGVETEEDVRLATYSFLKNLTREMGVNVKIQNEKIVLTGGRIDSLFDNIIFEFKKPNYFDSKAGIGEATEGRVNKGKRKGGLIEYLLSIAISESNNLEDFKKHLSTKLGIGFDGKSFVFVRYVFNISREIPLQEYKKRIANSPNWLPDNLDGDFEVSGKREIKNGLRFLFLYLRSISPRAPLTPYNVSHRFGEKSQHFKKHLRVIYSLLNTKLNKNDTHTKTLYEEWDRVFGKVYGDLNNATSDVKRDMAEKYAGNIDEKIDLKLLIFSIHTYYNIILKLLVSTLFSSLLNPFSTQRTVLALTDERFKQHVISTVQGESFANLGVENFFETGFFEWWTYVWNENISELLREVISLLEELEVTTSITKPELIGDVVKETYHGLMPSGLRHLLGEYFTPDWLAEYAIEKVGFKGELNKTLLDTACGSGTFLALAIKKKITHNQDKANTELINNIIHTIVGFDLNPISVIASKTNYLLALGDLSELQSPIKIPVYQCDSILTPAVHARQKKDTDTFEIDTVCGKFFVPALKTREEIEEILDNIRVGIKNDFNENELLKKVKTKYKEINEKAVKELFAKIKKLTKLNKNGLWIPILKNSFAPVYSEGQFDFVIGNPPWVSWRSMSKSYRELTLPIWLSYDIFNKSAYDMITTHDDFAMAFTYVSADHYLKKDGKLCFVISQAFFKSKKGGEGFRKFEITKDKQKIPLKVHDVTDMVSVKPFNEVTNRTSVLLLEKGKKTEYPLPYIVWKPKKKIDENMTLLEVKRNIEEKTLEAVPIGGTKDDNGLRSPWLTLPHSEIKKLSHALGNSPYRGRKGIEPLGAKGIYLLKEPHNVSGKLQICNLLERGRLQEVKNMGEHVGLIEKDFIYPLISGRNIAKYGIIDYCYCIMPHENKKGVHNAIPESDMKVKYTETYQWLSYFKKVLLTTRERNSKFYDKKKDPFYFMDNVGTYTFSPYKVVWREQNKTMVSCVISTKQDQPLKGKLIIPDSKVLFCPMESLDESHYLCAILNSKIVTDLIEGYTLELQRGIDILDNIKIPQFDPQNKKHLEISALSKQAHEAYKNKQDISKIQEKIDKIVFNIF